VEDVPGKGELVVAKGVTPAAPAAPAAMATGAMVAAALAALAMAAATTKQSARVPQLSASAGGAAEAR
jgi:hypothetical protein